jgi:carboxymethylenebutenolidase
MLDHHAMARTFLYDAGHGFNSDRRADHHGPSARLALERTLDLFESASIPPRRHSSGES